MINLRFCSGHACVWNVKDIMTLREKYRIVGYLIGSYPEKPFQLQTKWLPLKLMPEETKLLIDKGIAQLVSISKDPPDLAIIQQFYEQRDKLCEEQVSIYKENRKKQILEKVDEIVKGKKRKYLKALENKKKAQKLSETSTVTTAEPFSVQDGDAESKSFQAKNNSTPTADLKKNVNEPSGDSATEGEKNVKGKEKNYLKSIEKEKEAQKLSETSTVTTAEPLSGEDRDVESKSFQDKNSPSSTAVLKKNVENQSVGDSATEGENNVTGKEEKYLKSNEKEKDAQKLSETSTVTTAEPLPGEDKDVESKSFQDKSSSTSSAAIKEKVENQSVGDSATEGEKNLSSESQECNLESINIDKQTIIDSELAKVTSISKTTRLVQLFTECPWKIKFDPVKWEYPSTEREKLRCAVYKDLWEKKYYITSGLKFGGDFLAYEGDPLKYHALFIIVCMSREQKLQSNDLVTYGRLGHQVKKTVALASLNERGKVEYLSLSWENEMT